MSEESVYYVEEYNHHIPLLLDEEKEGFIHSIFSNGFNFKMGNHLFFMGSKKNGRLPFSIILLPEELRGLLSKLKIEMPVQWNPEEESLLIDHRFTVKLERSLSYENKLNRIPFIEPRLLHCLEEILIVLSDNGEKTGTNIDVNDFMEHYVQEKVSNTDLSYQFYYDLMDAIYSNDRNFIEGVLRYFLGRGKGTTPSGDDHIVGVLAIQRVTGKCSPAFLEVLSCLIENESITTDISKEYLRYALKGQFGSPVIEVIKEMMQPNSANLNNKILNLLSMGHSSGLDTMFGILLGLLAIRRERNGR